MPHCSATFSAVIPMWSPLKTSVSPSTSIVSRIGVSPIRAPQRAAGTTYGAADMFSVPPTTTTRASPARIARAPSTIVFIPEPHSMLTVVAVTSTGMPAPTAACRATF